MNPKFLLKDELLYELCIRGISSDTNVQTLRRLFKSLVSEGLPVDVSNLSSLGVEELYGSVVIKTVELQNLVTQSKSGLSLLTPRFRTRISHLRGSLTHLTSLGLFPSNITTSHYQELHDQLDRIEQNIASFEMADRQGQGKDEQDDMYSLTPGTCGTHPNLLPDKGGDHLGVEDGQGTGVVSTVTVDVNNDTGVRAAQVAQAGAGINAATSPPLGQSASQVFIPYFYQRLPHPLSHLLKELPVADGTDVKLLCDFRLKVIKVRQVGQITEATIYEIMYPYCRSELSALVTNAITARESFEIFHVRLLR
jgi:hypothetical protein